MWSFATPLQHDLDPNALLLRSVWTHNAAISPQQAARAHIRGRSGRLETEGGLAAFI